LNDILDRYRMNLRKRDLRERERQRDRKRKRGKREMPEERDARQRK
jgi:hypothetical protein